MRLKLGFFFFFFCIRVSCNMQNQSHFPKMWLSLPRQSQSSWWNWILAVVGVPEMYHVSHLQIIDRLPAMHYVLSPQSKGGNWEPSIGWLVNVHRPWVSVHLMFPGWIPGPACKAFGQGGFWGPPGCIEVCRSSQIHDGMSLYFLYLVSISNIIHAFIHIWLI